VTTTKTHYRIDEIVNDLGDGIAAVPNRWQGVDLSNETKPHLGFLRLDADDGNINVRRFNDRGVMQWQAIFALTTPSSPLIDFVRGGLPR
jgi:hypothetical protein